MSDVKRIVPPKVDSESEATDALLEALRVEGILRGPHRPDWTRFEALRSAVRAHFEVPWTSITPPMERLLYGIVATHRPQTLLAIGIYCGNTFVWNAGAACGPGKCYDARQLVGVDVDENAIELARKNFDKIGTLDDVVLLAADGHQVIENFDAQIDLLYLDAYGPLPGTEGPKTKKIYLSLLERAYDKIPRGGLVVAHDTVPVWFVENAGEYLDFVRDPAHFELSVSVEPDDEGLEVSVR